MFGESRLICCGAKGSSCEVERPYTDFELGMLHGKMSALVASEHERDFLDTRSPSVSPSFTSTERAANSNAASPPLIVALRILQRAGRLGLLGCKEAGDITQRVTDSAASRICGADVDHRSRGFSWRRCARSVGI